jgi:archaemetzincin
MFRYHSILTFLLVVIHGCSNAPDKPVTAAVKERSGAPPFTLKVLPLGRVTTKFVNETFADLKQVIPGAVLLPGEQMPRQAYYAPRKRYRADTLIHWMSDRAAEHEVFLGITMQDISTTKGDNPDYGVMGLGFQPGKACMASSFRLRKKENFFKVTIHELGHTMGLPHCPEKTCFMRDAEGGDPTGEEKAFCTRCRKFLAGKGWKL